MKHAAHLDIAEFIGFVIALYEVATAIALTEFGRRRESLDSDLNRTDGLEEDVL
jgi:hypothetical protein